MERHDLQTTGTTTGQVPLNVLPVLRGQQGVLQQVNVSMDLVIHRHTSIKQSGEIKDHASCATHPILALEAGCCMDQKS